MKIADLSRQISDSLEDLDIITIVRKGFFEIIESDKTAIRLCEKCESTICQQKIY